MFQNRYVKLSLKILAWVFGLILIVWIALYIYLSYNTGKIRSTLISELEKRTESDVSIGKVSPNFFSTFPYISLELRDVIIRDSLWASHHKDLLKASFVYLRVSPVSLLSKSRVGRVILRNAAINIFTDTAGYSNNYIINGEYSATPDKKKGAPSLPDIALENVSVIFENPIKNKYHSASIKKLVWKMSGSGSSSSFKVNTNMKVLSLAFNTSKGSYIKNTQVEGNIKGKYNSDSKELSFDDVVLKLDKTPVRVSGIFRLSAITKNFSLRFSARNVDFSKVAMFLPDSLQTKVKPYRFEQPVSFSVSVDGVMLYKNQPHVIARMAVKNNALVTPFGTIDNCSFESEFTNQVDSTEARLDFNSRLALQNFIGRWGNIPLQSDTIRITHLKRPFLECDLKSTFELKELNELTGSNTLLFTGGTSKLDVTFKGPIGGTDSVESELAGYITLIKGGFKYLPRQLEFQNATGSLEFKGKDVLVRKLSVESGRSKIVMNGAAKNILSMLNISPEKLTLEWNIHSPYLHLEDFSSFLSQQNRQARTSNNKAVFQRTAGNIDKMFVEGDVYLSLDANKMDYKKFNAQAVKADVTLSTSSVKLNKLSMNHAGGSIAMSGSMSDKGTSNAITFNAQLNKLQIPSLFSAFNNFGQDALTSKNIDGSISATINMNAAVTNKAQLISESTDGTISFNVENGELIRFEPMMKISETALKKQDMTHIKFADLKNRLQVKNTAFLIDKMEIRSTAFTMFVEGVYDIKNGTDLSIQFPLRNLTKDQSDTDLSDKAKKGVGIAIRLRARTGDDGKLKVSWDPFKRSLRNKEEVEDTIKAKGKK